MEGQIIHFRRGKRTQYERQMIVTVKTVTNKDQAQSLIKKIVIWKSPAGKEIKGTIMNLHGVKGAVRVHFEKGMPGQAIGAKVLIQ